MDKKIAGLLGAAAALTTVSGAYATAMPTTTPAAATTYRDLLEPIPDAVAALKADDATRAQQPSSGVQLAQYHHHHHHHHHGYSAGAAILGGVIGGIIAAQPPHCYWTLGQPYWNGYRWIRPRVRVCQ